MKAAPGSARGSAGEATKRRSIRDAIRSALGKDALDKASSPSTQMSIALGAKPVYAGTVAKAEIQRRRARNKRARQARAMHRRIQRGSAR
jgi:hypothetical protein